MTNLLSDSAALSRRVGEEVAVSDWLTITQEQINLFAEATGDRQWIHVDPDRAAAGPFGAPIAHGYLTLSLISKFFLDAMAHLDSGIGVNYGLDRVRFPSPVPVGSRVRGRIKLLACEALDKDAAQFVWQVTIDLDGSPKPACVAQALTRRYR